jgi:hypothetical protein
MLRETIHDAIRAIIGLIILFATTAFFVWLFGGDITFLAFVLSLAALILLEGWYRNGHRK